MQWLAKHMAAANCTSQYRHIAYSVVAHHQTDSQDEADMTEDPQEAWLKQTAMDQRSHTADDHSGSQHGSHTESHTESESGADIGFKSGFHSGSSRDGSHSGSVSGSYSGSQREYKGARRGTVDLLLPAHHCTRRLRPDKVNVCLVR